MNVMNVVHVRKETSIHYFGATLMCRKVRADVIRGILEVGYLTEINAADQFNFPKLTIENNFMNSMVFSLGAGTAIILELRIAADRPVNIQQFGAFELAGQLWHVDFWLEEEYPIYSLPGGLSYPRDIVLNHRIGKKGRVRPGLRMEGMLLGISENSVPLDLRGSEIPARLAIDYGFDTCDYHFSIRFDQEYSCRPQTRRKSSLFDGGKVPDEYRSILEGDVEANGSDK